MGFIPVSITLTLRKTRTGWSATVRVNFFSYVQRLAELTLCQPLHEDSAYVRQFQCRCHNRSHAGRSRTDRTAVIACSKEAKNFGVKNVMPIKDAKRLCPDLILVPQNPDLYRRAHNALLCEIETVIAIDTAKSIDELTCVLDDNGKRDPELLAARIKAVIADNISPYITCSIGFGANRQLAKIACKAGKEETKRRGSYGNGLAIWRPAIMPAPLLRVELDDIPGVGSNMAKRLYRNGVFTTAQLYALQPKHMRKIWNSVNGERLWYAVDCH